MVWNAFFGVPHLHSRKTTKYIFTIDLLYNYFKNADMPHRSYTKTNMKLNYAEV
jgi:hypothetical protein